MQEKINQYIQDLKDSKSYAYYERNQLVAALSKMFPAWIEQHPDSDTTWENDWRNIVFIDLPTGQASWHIHDSEFNNFQHLPQKLNTCSWDGHTNDEKYKRLAAIPLRATDKTIDALVGALEECDKELSEGYDTIDWYYGSPLQKKVEAALSAAKGV